MAVLEQVWDRPDARLVNRPHADWCHPVGGIRLWHTACWDTDSPGVAEAETRVLAWYRDPRLRERCFDTCLDEDQPEEVQTMAGLLYDGLRHIRPERRLNLGR